MCGDKDIPASRNLGAWLRMCPLMPFSGAQFTVSLLCALTDSTCNTSTCYGNLVEGCRQSKDVKCYPIQWQTLLLDMDRLTYQNKSLAINPATLLPDDNPQEPSTTTWRCGTSSQVCDLTWPMFLSPPEIWISTWMAAALFKQPGMWGKWWSQAWSRPFEHKPCPGAHVPKGQK